MERITIADLFPFLSLMLVIDRIVLVRVEVTMNVVGSVPACLLLPKIIGKTLVRVVTVFLNYNFTLVVYHELSMPN